MEGQRESLWLCILASLGTGEEMILGDIKKLSAKNVKKYYFRYQTLLGKQVIGSLVESTISISAKIISNFISIDDTEELSRDLNE